MPGDFTVTLRVNLPTEADILLQEQEQELPSCESPAGTHMVCEQTVDYRNNAKKKASDNNKKTDCQKKQISQYSFGFMAFSFRTLEECLNLAQHSWFSVKSGCHQS